MSPVNVMNDPAADAADVTCASDDAMTLDVNSAIQGGALGNLESLLEAGASPDGAVRLYTGNNYIGLQTHLQTAMQLCVLGLDRYGCVSVLLEYGADKNIMNDGETAEQYAASEGDQRLLDILARFD
jgi:ankyrin repeat protein